MYETFVWVPTKGWKLLIKTRDVKKALAKAQEFEPLEVKFRTPQGSSYYGGHAWMPRPNDKYQPAIDIFASELIEREKTNE